jgi:hypothetical protein
MDNEGSWLCVLDWDDGTRKYQEHQWSEGIPDPVAKQLNNCTKKGRRVTNVAWGEDGSWFVKGEKYDGSGSYWWGAGEHQDIFESSTRVAFGNYGSSVFVVYGEIGFMSVGIPQELLDRAHTVHKQGKMFESVCLKSDGEGWWVRDICGCEWDDLPLPLGDELQTKKQDLQVVSSSSGWVVIRANQFLTSQGVPAELTKVLASFYSNQRSQRQRRDQEITSFRARRGEQQRLNRDREAQQHRIRDEAHRRSMLAKQEAEELITVEVAREARDSQASAVRYLRAARELASNFGFQEIAFNEGSRLVSFLSTMGSTRINVYYTTRTVGTCLPHPSREHPTQLFRRDVSLELLGDIFKQPRVHTGSGYFRRDRMPRRVGPGSAADVSMLGRMDELVGEELAVRDERAAIFVELQRGLGFQASASYCRVSAARRLVTSGIKRGTETGTSLDEIASGGSQDGLTADLSSMEAVRATIIVGSGGSLGVATAGKGSFQITQCDESSGVRIGDHLFGMKVPIRNREHFSAAKAPCGGRAIIISVLRSGLCLDVTAFPLANGVTGITNTKEALITGFANPSPVINTLPMIFLLLNIHFTSL